VKAGGALVLAADAGEAALRATGEARAFLGGRPPSFAVLFASAHFFGSAETLVAAVAEETGGVPLIGCVADAVAGGAREVESGPAVSLWLAADPGPVETFGMEFVPTASGGAFGGYRFGPGFHLMICDPFTFPAGDLLAHLNEHVPGTVVMGGMASGGLRMRQSRLFLDDRVLAGGAVGAHLPRAGARPLVAQGCRPVGDPYTVTRAEGNVILELGGRPPLGRLRELAAALAGPERELLAQGPHLGLVIDEYQAEPGQGDFLVRGIAGADPGSGAIAVGGEVEMGQTVQFHVRDARSADEDLRRALEREAADLGGRAAAGALLFTCTGRGTRLFAAPDHDAGLIAKVLGEIPVAGFFCDGELGPVGGQNFLHTFTASIALFPEITLPRVAAPLGLVAEARAGRGFRTGTVALGFSSSRCPGGTRMTWTGDEMAASGGYFLASHADRERVIDTLKAAFEQGRLAKDELETRVARALGARTYADLAAITADIPAGTGPARPPRALNLTPVWWGVGVFSGFPPILIAAGVLSGSEGLASVGVGLFILDFIVAVLAGVIAIGTAVDTRMKNRRAAGPPPGSRGGAPRGGPPPGGPRRRAFGHEPVPPEARRDETGAEARSVRRPPRPAWQGC